MSISSSSSFYNRQRTIQDNVAVECSLLVSALRTLLSLFRQYPDNAIEAGQWLGEFVQEADQAVVETVEVIEDALRPAIGSISQQIDEGLDMGEAFVHQQLVPWLEETAAPISHTINPFLQDHPTCVGCAYYNGTDYGGNMLVCAMHPYGPDDRNCADWESVWPGASSASDDA